jgi:hypothetical protein
LQDIAGQGLGSFEHRVMVTGEKMPTLVCPNRPSF